MASCQKMSIQGIRRLEKDDIPAVENLISTETNEYFGKVNLPKLIEHSFLSLCVYNTDSQIVAAAIFQNSPNVPAIPKWDWIPWVKNLYKLNNLTNRNTLFIHFMAWDSKYKFQFPIHLFTTVFYTLFYVHNIILVAPPNSSALEFLEKYFTIVSPNDYENSKKVQKLYLTVQRNFISRYKIRRAVEEDNDDIVALIGNHTDRLKKLYGDFYISEIIRLQEMENIDCSKQRQIIVAESNERAIGMLCLTTDISFEELNKCFELEPFYGLRKPDLNDIDTNDINITAIQADTVENFIISDEYSEQSQSEENKLLHEESSNIIFSSINSESSSEFTILDEIPSFHVSPDELETRDSSTDLTHVTSCYSCEILTYDPRSQFKLLNKFNDNVELKKLSITNTPFPKYNGAPNAFAIELFASIKEDEKTIIANLIEGAFECYPDRNYCILSIPSTYPPSPFLQNFVRVIPRSYSIYPHELYVLHRNSLLSELEVREANASDITTVQNLFNGIRNKKQIFADFSNSVLSNNNQLKSYVLTTEKCIVGCIIILPETAEYNFLNSQYILSDYIDLEQYSSDSVCRLVHAIISPIFQIHKRFFLREVHRLSDLSIIYYSLYPNETTETVEHKTLPNVIDEMIVIEPRVCFDPHKSINEDNSVYALYIMTLRYCSLLKIDIDKKLVIVGASMTGLSFLQNIIFGETAPYLSFTNITLVSTHGLNYSKSSNYVRDFLFPYEGKYNYNYMRKIAFQCHTNIVIGVMTAINRDEKHIIVDNHYIIPYDYLFLTCGEQYQIPEQILNSDSLQEHPENVFIINTEIDGNNAFKHLKFLIGNSTNYNVIVYGVTLEAYCCLTALLEFGIPGMNITFVEPFPDRDKINDISLFNDPNVDDAVYNSIKKKGITFYTSYYIKSWKYIPKTNRIKSIKFESQFNLMEIECIAIFYYYKKTVNDVTLSAINRAGLVYDSRLVIDPLYQTNDPNIFAAGTMTKYSRHYYADHLNQKYFNHMEVGATLALYTKRNLDPTFELVQESYVNEILTPVFSQPIIKYCTLPDGLNYLSISKPGKSVSNSELLCKKDYGRVLITNGKHDKIQYFRLHLNLNNIIETITCLTNEPIDVQNIIKLWGKHEKMLNNLLIRFDSGLINDFFEYFRQPWIHAIFHECFQEKVEYINKRILYGIMCDEEILHKVISLLQSNRWEELTEEQRKEIITLYDTSIHKKKIQQNLLDFLLFYDMSMYAHPLKIKQILAGCKTSPLHFQQ